MFLWKFFGRNSNKARVKPLLGTAPLAQMTIRRHGTWPIGKPWVLFATARTLGLAESLGPASLARVPQSDQVVVVVLNPGVELRFCHYSCFSPGPVRMAVADYST